MEALVVLMSMEASIVLSQLRVFLNTVVESTEPILFVRASVIARVIALVLLHAQMSKLLPWNVLPSHIIVIPSQLIVAFLVEVETLWIKEVTTWKNIEVVLIVLSRSVLDLLSSVLLDSRNCLERLAWSLDTILRRHAS